MNEEHTLLVDLPIALANLIGSPHHFCVTCRRWWAAHAGEGREGMRCRLICESCWLIAKFLRKTQALVGRHMLGVDEERALLADLPIAPRDCWLQLLYQ